jgi:predicted Rossmann fold nucleotide-binding protein DprA/Smf involved in DNA uptake
MATEEVKLSKTDVFFLIDWGNRKHWDVGATDVERKLMKKLGAVARRLDRSAKAKRAESTDGWTQRAAAVFAARPESHFHARSLAKALGCKIGTAGTTLSRLERAGVAVRIKRGLYVAAQRNLPFTAETATKTEAQEAA